jgi:hypothetical protein
VLFNEQPSLALLVAIEEDTDRAVKALSVREIRVINEHSPPSSQMANWSSFLSNSKPK